MNLSDEEKAALNEYLSGRGIESLSERLISLFAETYRIAKAKLYLKKALMAFAIGAVLLLLWGGNFDGYGPVFKAGTTIGLLYAWGDVFYFADIRAGREIVLELDKLFTIHKTEWQPKE